MVSLFAVAFTAGSLLSPPPAHSQMSILPSLPRGTYVASQYTCTRYIEVGLLRLDDKGVSPIKSACRIVSHNQTTSDYEQLCHEIDDPADDERVKLQIKQTSSQSMSVNGTVYNYCKGL